MAYIKIIILCLILMGCSSVPVPIDTPVVKQCPIPPTINRPDLPIENLTNKSTDDEIMLATKVSIRLLQKWGMQLESILDGYRNK